MPYLRWWAASVIQQQVTMLPKHATSDWNARKPRNQRGLQRVGKNDCCVIAAFQLRCGLTPERPLERAVLKRQGKYLADIRAGLIDRGHTRHDKDINSRILPAQLRDQR